jgi:hypothetical protein
VVISGHQRQSSGNHLKLPADLQRLEPACRFGRGWLHWPELAESDQVRNWLAIVVVERVVPDEAGHQRSSEVIRGHQRSSEVIRRCSYLMRQAIRGHQKSARAQWGVRALCEARCRTRRALAASRAVQT